jgi:GAF domain-containing protein
MKKRSRAGGEANKGRRRKAPEPKRRNAPKAVAPSISSSTAKETEVAQLSRELSEAREQQTATSEVLQVIKSFGELEPVFQTILANATRLCEAKYGNLNLFADGAFQLVASHSVSAALASERLGGPLIQPAPGTGLGRMLTTKTAVQIVDVLTDQDYPRDHPLRSAAEREGIRTLLCVPMIKEDELIGGIAIFRQEVRPFTEKQIELVKNFAAQAVIAIENARLLNELRQRTTDLSESLEQQTATSDVLQIISSSPSDLQPVFVTMLENAVRICDAKFGDIFRWDGDGMHLVATHNTPAAFAEALSRSPRISSGSTIGNQVRSTKSAVHVADLSAHQDYLEQRSPGVVDAVELEGVRTCLVVPMLKDEEFVGMFILNRQEVRPFTDKQIELVKNFAAQAVIAIENARLLNELRLRTSDLTESLEQQTATSEVLQVISSSPHDLEPVFSAMLEKAVHICAASFGNVYRWDGEALRLAASHNTPAGYAEARARMPFRPNDNNTVAGRLIVTKTAAHIADIRTEQAYLAGDPTAVAAVELAGVRTFLAVPMLKENELIGAFILSRQEVRPFTDKQIELVNNFAAQAVIAIENARLLNELRRSLEQQTATGEILSSMSGSIADTKPVFDAIVRNLLRLFDTRFASINLLQDGMTYLVAVAGEPGFERMADLFPRSLSDENFSGRAMLLKRPFQFTPVVGNPAVPPFGQQIARDFGFNSIVFAPMIRGDKVVGAIGTAHRDAKPFSEQQVGLLKAFADQAVIAIENTRLLKELRERTQEVEKLNQHLEQRVSDQVGEIERMSRLRRFLPPQVADLIVASGTEKQLESHRREITALFCDLRGFTGFTESADAEDVIALLREYHAAVGEKIIKYSGTLERYAGDGVMVVFNDPVPVENPALQAVLMALEMRDAIGALTETWHRWGHEIGFGIGIAHGFATLGTIGFEGRFDYAAIGTVSNVASRLCDEAKPGQILISPRVLTKVENAVTVEPVGEFELKGIRRPLAAYNVLAAASREN